MAQNIYKIVGGSGGRCGCGHNQRLKKPYYLVDTGDRQFSMCEQCGIERGLHQWWGVKKEITVDEMERHWFGGTPVKEVVCRQLRRYMRESKRESVREKMLESAVEV